MPDPLTNALSEAFALDMPREVTRIGQSVREALRTRLHRRGLVVAISGGIDSAVSAALSVEAVGPQRVYGLLMPEADSSPESLERGRAVVERLGIEHTVIDIEPTLRAIGCYQWRDEAIRRVFPDYGPGWKSKITIGGAGHERLSHFHLVVQDEDGNERRERLRSREYLQIVAATNFKQRVRKTLEYFHADRLNHAVVGTPNRVEYHQGFFVKNGDGAADLKPIAHLYKVQVYAMGKHLGLPPSVCSATPTTDTYSLPQGQDEFYYALPYQEMDIALWHYDHQKRAEELATVLGVPAKTAEGIYADIERKHLTTASLHWPALLVEPGGQGT